MKPLRSSISALMPIIAAASPRFGAGEDEGGIITAPPPTEGARTPDVSQVDDEGPAPDWATFEKAAGLKPDDADDTKPDDTNGKPVEKKADDEFDKAKARRDKEQKDADAKSAADAEAKKKTDDAASAETKRKADEAKAASDKAAAEAAKKRHEGKTPDDIDKLELPKTASTDSKMHFGKLKAITKDAIAENAALKAENETLKKTAETKQAELPPDVKTKLDRFSQMEEFEQAWLLEKSPAFQAKYEAPIAKANDQLRAYLKSIKTPENLIEEFVTKREEHPRISEAEKLLGTQGARMLKRHFDAVGNAILDRDQAVDNLRGDKRKEYIDTHNKGLQEKEQGFWREAGKEATAMMKDNDQTIRKPIPEGATDVQKKAIETHNDLVGKRSEVIAKLTQEAIINRDPKATAELSYRAYRVEWLEAERDELTKAKTDLEERVKDLEERIAGKRKAGSVTHAAAPTAKPKGSEGKTAPDDDRTADQAADDFFKGSK